MLYARSDRARHVRSLGLYPDSGGRTSKRGRSALPDAYQVSSAVRRAARNFEALRTFAWDGEELPPDDDLWFALRISWVFPYKDLACDLLNLSSAVALVSSSFLPRLVRSYPYRTPMHVADLLLEV